MAGTDEEAVIVAQHRATDRFKEAWKIISPKPEHRAECEYDLVRALLTIPVAVGLDKSKPAENKKNLRRDAKKLRAAIPAVSYRFNRASLSVPRSPFWEPTSQAVGRCPLYFSKQIGWRRQRSVHRARNPDR